MLRNTALPFIDLIDSAAIPSMIRDSDVMATRRADAGDRYRKAEWPHRRMEAWKYTDLSRWALALAEMDGEAETATPVGASRSDIAARVEEVAGDGPRLVFIDGKLDEALSRNADLPDGVELRGIANAVTSGAGAGVEAAFDRAIPADGRIFASLNEALMSDGFCLSVAAGTVVKPVIDLCFINTTPSGGGVHLRGLITVAPNAEAAVVEHHIGLTDRRYFVNLLTDISVADGARLHHYKYQDEGAGALHIANALSRLGRDASYDGFILSLGADTARNEIYSLLEAPGGETRLSGAYLGRSAQHMDTTILVDHAAPDCVSRQVYKGVLDDQARGVFQGKILVRREAQRTDGFQMNRGLLLSPRAEIDAKPELEIYADDVKCSHGSTIGEIDTDALFYLQSRGIDAAEARGLLIEAYVDEAIDEVRVPSVRQRFSEQARRWMAAR